MDLMSSITLMECVRADSDVKIVHSLEYSNNKIKEKLTGRCFSSLQSLGDGRRRRRQDVAPQAGLYR